MLPCRHTHPLIVVSVTMLALASATTRAASPPGEDAAIAAEVAQILPHVATQAGNPSSPQHQAMLARFVDHLDLARRLQSLHSLKLLPLWDSGRFSVFLGVDRHGMAGLHIQQQDPAVTAQLLARDTLPDTLPDNLPPLRAVPLSSP
ncbi:MAG: hypothetical protein NTZ79_15750 [Proteobacteria bacterium]|nr:hypothetical protein [Pseudomonadota bacterium]